MTDTYNATTLSTLLANGGNKPVYAFCAYNFYNLRRVVDTGTCIIIESYEDNGIEALDDDYSE